jgi:hypothetical protein
MKKAQRYKNGILAGYLYHGDTRVEPYMAVFSTQASMSSIDDGKEFYFSADALQSIPAEYSMEVSSFIKIANPGSIFVYDGGLTLLQPLCVACITEGDYTQATGYGVDIDVLKQEFDQLQNKGLMLTRAFAEINTEHKTVLAWQVAGSSEHDDSWLDYFIDAQTSELVKQEITNKKLWIVFFSRRSGIDIYINNA